MNCYSNKINIENADKLKKFFEEDWAVLVPVQNALWRYKKSDYSATLYNTGKLLVQGASIDSLVSKIEDIVGLNISIQNKLFDQNHTSDFSLPPKERIGVDESGKGDFFGPLVISSVMVDENSSEILVKSGIKDCKKIDDKNITRLAAIIKNNCTFSVVTISPAKYNELYSKLKNLNYLLAWGHARAIENILEKKDCKYALSDKFGDEKLIKNALLKLGKSIHLEQRCKAESDIAVAAASILAREQFLKWISEMSVKYGVSIPKGASEKVILAAEEIKDKFSKDELKNLVKTHFKTFSQI